MHKYTNKIMIDLFVFAINSILWSVNYIFRNSLLIYRSMIYNA